MVTVTNFRCQEDIQDCCSICTDVLKQGEELCAHNGGGELHSFHKDCFIEYLVKSNQAENVICPVCRRIYTDISGEVQSQVDIIRGRGRTAKENQEIIRLLLTGIGAVGLGLVGHAVAESILGTIGDDAETLTKLASIVALVGFGTLVYSNLSLGMGSVIAGLVARVARIQDGSIPLSIAAIAGVSGFCLIPRLVLQWQGKL